MKGVPSEINDQYSILKLIGYNFFIELDLLLNFLY